jgi:glycosyltransferase involved in cell wall biosynthesis
MSSPTVSLIVPMRNEEKYIANCVASLLRQNYPGELYEIIVVDGRSSDSSKAIVATLCREHPNVHCCDNPSAIVPCGMNIGIRKAQGEIIIRADGHTVYPPNYVQNCVECLERTGADNVGGPCVTVPANDSLSARLVAAVLSSPFGVGDAQFRIGSKQGYVDTVPFGAFRRELFDRIGLYNERLVRNQDVDLNARIRKAGGKIYQSPALQTEYHPVAGFWELLRLTFRTSQWHLFSVSENGTSLGLRHFAPAVFVAVLAVLATSSVFSREGFLLFAALLVVYFLVGFCVVTLRPGKEGFLMRCALPFACLCFHVSYGLGTLAGARYLLKAPSSRPIRAGQPVS